MSAIERTKTRRFLPYRSEPFGLALTVSRLQVDGVDQKDKVDAVAHLVALEDLRPEHVVAELELVLPAKVVESVLPESERGAPPLSLLVVIRCPDTRIRRAQLIASGPIKGGVFKAPLELSCDEVVGQVELVPILVRDAAAKDPKPGFAAHLGARVAGARPWTIRLAKARAPLGEHLDIRYESFKASVDSALWAGALYRLDCESESPILWLNKDHERIVEVLDSKGTVGLKARLREVLFDSIGAAVWSQLFARAADSLANEAIPSFGWCEAVTERYLPKLFPQASDHEARLGLLKEEWKEGAHPVLARLDRVLQIEQSAPRQITKLVEEAAP